MICLLLYILGIVSGIIGMVLTWVVTFLPQWRLVILAENNGFIYETGRIDGEWINRWDGLWETCIGHRRLTLRCYDYGSRISLTGDFKAGRVFMGFAIAVALLATIFSLVGIFMDRCSCCCRSSCCSCCRTQCEDRRCLFLTGGILYLVTLCLILIPVIWIVVNINYDGYDAQVTRGAVRIEIGDALMVVWPCLLFLLIGGVILCATSCSCCNFDNDDCSKTNCSKVQGGYEVGYGVTYEPPCDEAIMQRKVPCTEPYRGSPGMLYI